MKVFKDREYGVLSLYCKNWSQYLRMREWASFLGLVHDGYLKNFNLLCWKREE
jgi:phage terminase small subunit